MKSPVVPSSAGWTSRPLPGGLLNVAQHAIKCASIEQAAGRDHRSNPPRVLDVLKRVLIQEYEISTHVGLDCSEIVQTHEARWISCWRLLWLDLVQSAHTRQ